MRVRLLGPLAAAALALAATATHAQRAFEISPAVQAEIDRQKSVIAAWAASPEVVSAVREQNARGPIPGMDNAKWKATRRADLTVRGFQMNPAGRFLKRKLDESGVTYSEAFLSAARGEKVAFVEKTTSYIHKGQPKFDVPFQTGQTWQGKPELDDSSQMYMLQLSVPVLDQAKPIGVLVVGVNVSHLERIARR
ncbi:MAG: hypothetical protein ACE147_11030 [Candidatus Methylomirabilales bacterium]